MKVIRLVTEIERHISITADEDSFVEIMERMYYGLSNGGLSIPPHRADIYTAAFEGDAYQRWWSCCRREKVTVRLRTTHPILIQLWCAKILALKERWSLKYYEAGERFRILRTNTNVWRSSGTVSQFRQGFV